jgi:predicted PilT family ATPase
LTATRSIEERKKKMAGMLDNEEEVNAQIEAVLSDDQADYDHMIQDRAILKMLVTDNIAGAIIGKNGKAIADLQDECGAKIKVSQSADFYPGTSERTILITGWKFPQSGLTSFCSFKELEIMFFMHKILFGKKLHRLSSL